MTAATLRDLLDADHVTHVPGVFDPASAALAVRAGNRAVLLSGAAVAATMRGRPGVEVTPPTQIADRAATIKPALGDVPLLADADLGYDDRSDAVWTALAYERAGVGGLHLDDGANPARATTRIAELAERVPSVVVIARATGTGPADMVARCRAYAAAGAHAVLPVGVADRARLTEIRNALPGVRLAISRSESATACPALSDAELAALGVRLVLHPLAAVRSALAAMAAAYREILDEGEAQQELSWAEFAELTGQEPVPPLQDISRYAGEPSPEPWLNPPRPRPGRPSPSGPSGVQQDVERLDRLGT
ncbi:methylisocitrate lyase [Actinoplanes sp. TBRC 11911]|uniref:isocitrate lyase/phosphoenolpyruvate mutase family protein n=1 Tax=Actinoplanes sp. TBRC 11911 TaxID=2729386 RepID=UPI00145DC676|nr:isocitrate lyase/phosphoenolpyruvate mutase family protein [Actinoplanes sp. TBRC 11911]NMO51628.1 methylisocitrate lyase [Actinoplanes sp. TBRC 11911]